MFLNWRLIERRRRSLQRDYQKKNEITRASLNAPLPWKKLQSSGFENRDFQERGEIHQGAKFMG